MHDTKLSINTLDLSHICQQFKRFVVSGRLFNVKELPCREFYENSY